MKLKFKSILIIGCIGIAAYFSTGFVNNYFEVSKNLDIFATLYKEINTYYVDEIEPTKIMRKGIDAMLESLDPYTSFISEAEIEDYRFQTTGKYGGIGSLIRKSGDHVIIAEPYEGFPAHKAGLRAGDIILEIDGKSATKKNTTAISKILKGQPGTEVKILIKRPGANENITKTLVREEIKVDNVPYYGMINENVGYIRLSNFTEKAGKNVRKAFEELKKDENLKALIFDLRGNPGGLLTEAVNVSNVFIDKGEEVVSTKGKIKDWDKQYKTLIMPVDLEIPLAVLTDRGSASASEIVSGVIQDLDRGVIIGQKSFGKGLVQTTRPLSYNSQLKVTTAKYYIPSGRCIQAIDYSSRNKDGSTDKIPDSLRSEFKTRNGRLVYDGGGISPDIKLKPQKPAKITTSLLQKELFFQYATEFRIKHDSIPPAKAFKITEQVYNDFISFIADKDYDYTTKSEELLEDLGESAQSEKYYDAIEKDLAELKKKIIHDKQTDLQKHKAEIQDFLKEEIISRYYYQNGRIEASLENDPVVHAAIDIFKNSEKYDVLLKPKQN